MWYISVRQSESGKLTVNFKFWKDGWSECREPKMFISRRKLFCTQRLFSLILERRKFWQSFWHQTFALIDWQVYITKFKNILLKKLANFSFTFPIYLHFLLIFFKLYPNICLHFSATWEINILIKCAITSQRMAKKQMVIFRHPSQS